MRALPILVLLPLAVGCAGGASLPASPAPAGAAVWDALLRPRPSPLPGAPRIGIGALSVGEARPLGLVGSVSAEVGLQELVAAGLLRRRDIQFVERRRFAAAAERERRGLSAPPGAPPVGTSPGLELLLTGTLSPQLGDSAWFDLRLVEPATGGYRAAWRVGVPRGADPAALGRRVAGSLVAVLDSLGDLPRWRDPLAEAAPRTWRPSGVPVAAVEAFLRGVAAEDIYDWDAARRAYERARELGDGAFFEPVEALARLARLHAGGTLGTS